jgi:hypothetical protein
MILRSRTVCVDIPSNSDNAQQSEGNQQVVMFQVSWMEKVYLKSLKEGSLVECSGPSFKCEHHYLEQQYQQH